MAEEQELRLTVTLDDKASAQLAQLQQALGGLTGGQVTTGLGNLQRQTVQVTAGVQGMTQSMQTFARMAGFVGGVVGGVTSELTKMGVEFLRRATDLDAYSRAMVELSVNATRASQTAAQFQQHVRDFAHAGVGGEAAAAQLQKFADVVGNLQREQSSVREKLLGGLRGADFQDMQQLINQVASSDRSTALNAIKQRAEEIRAHWTKQGQAERGAAAMRDFLSIFGIPDLDRLEREMRKVNAAQEQLMSKRIDDAKIFDTATKDTSEAMDRVGKSLAATALLMPGVVQMMRAGADWATAWAARLEEIERRLREADEKANKAAPKPENWWERLNPFDPRNVRREGSVAPELQWNPAAPPPADQAAPYGRDRRGRAYPAPQSGGAQQLLGGGDEDRRASLVSNTDQVELVTEELKRLNDYFELQEFKGGKAGDVLGGRRGGLGAGMGPGGNQPMGTGPGSGPDTGTGPGTGPAGPPPIQWPEPSAGNVMPPGFGQEPGAGIGGVEGVEGASPWAATVGRGGVYAGQKFPVPEGWGPGGSGQPWGTTGGGGAPGGGGGSGDLDRGKYDAMFKGTPLEGQYDTVVQEAAKNNVPASVMAGIISFETGKGTSKMVRERLNPAGLMDPKTGMQKGQTFNTIEEGIAAAGRTIGNRYREAGGDLGKMGQAYAPVGARNDPNRTNAQWPASVGKAAQGLSTGQQQPNTQTAQNQPAQPNQRVASLDPNQIGGSTPGASQGLSGPQALAIARQHLGEDEIRDQSKLSAWFRERGMKLNPSATPWCAAFVNASLAQAGLPTSKDSPGSKSPSLAAASFYKYGTHVDPKDVQPGDIAVWPHHVAFTASGVGPGGQFQATGGNQGGTVSGRGGVSTGPRNARGVEFRRPPPGAYNPAAPQDQQPGTPGTARPGAVPYLLPGGNAIPSNIDTAAIDRSATQKVAVSGNGKVDVSVKTEPKEAASKKDLVKDVKIPRQQQMTPASTGPDHAADLDS